MRFEGVLCAWHPDAGYGAIRPALGGEEVFVNLTAFPTDGEGPRLDERLSFEIVSGRDGRKQAVRVQRLHGAAPAPTWRAPAGGAVSARARRHSQKKRRLALVAGAVFVVLLVACGMHWMHGGHRIGEVPAVMRR